MTRLTRLLLAAALRLSKLGARVTVLEKETLGWGASSRNGGIRP